MSKLADLIWKNAELLRGAYRENEYRKVILPFTILRRLDCVLAPKREEVYTQYEALRNSKYDMEKILTTISDYPFFNTSRFSLEALAQTPDDVRDNLEAMVNGFSQNVRDIFEKFGFISTINKLEEKGRLYLVVQRFAETDLNPDVVSNHDMGMAFEELLRKFNDVSPAGEQYTPRDVIELMVSLLFSTDQDLLSIPGIVKTMYDPTAGTGGLLSVGEEYVKRMNDRAVLSLFGQELEDETYAICKADMLIRGQNPANIVNEDTLKIDLLAGEVFDYQAANPPYGVEWKPAEDAVRREHKLGAAGRFAPGLPAIRDGQMLFSLHLLSKMRPFIDGKGGGRIGVVHNGSPLFAGDAGSGESEIRRYIMANDYLEAIVAMPTDLFYNTNIQTYLWFMTNRKPEKRQGKVMLLDASKMGVLMKKNLGKKRREFTEDCIAQINKAYEDFKDMTWKDPAGERVLNAKVFDNAHFHYRKVTIERPLRMRFQLTDFARDAVLGNPSFAKLPLEQRHLVGCLLDVFDSTAVFTNADDFRSALNAAADQVATTQQLTGKASRLTAKSIELLRKTIGVKDPKADITTDEKGSVISDSDLRDAEYVPMNKDVDAYFESEVKPHWPDAWINKEVVDSQDGVVGVVGTEINFNREFYVYKPPRSREEIAADIEAKEKKFMEMLKAIKGGEKDESLS
ncbi:class I SAM-dependent DNA methyltransferase [Limnobacter sp. MED105]|uniref:type I restriction-modification system subunit M n=1 Tax=Limnobacter sp. MED105 TaxID=391597 RepID=UPI000156C349|nr:class I SAM-dependent DNA methyltransferase [Limnobacter sp. MED105]EDM82800.1 type I restriction-modification system methyltransferase subunit [Limnobacter sp. MED105]